LILFRGLNEISSWGWMFVAGFCNFVGFVFCGICFMEG
jgi:hypothetical protein